MTIFLVLHLQCWQCVLQVSSNTSILTEDSSRHWTCRAKDTIRAQQHCCDTPLGKALPVSALQGFLSEDKHSNSVSTLDALQRHCCHCHQSLHVAISASSWLLCVLLFSVRTVSHLARLGVDPCFPDVETEGQRGDNLSKITWLLRYGHVRIWTVCLISKPVCLLFFGALLWT